MIGEPSDDDAEVPVKHVFSEADRDA